MQQLQAILPGSWPASRPDPFGVSVWPQRLASVEVSSSPTKENDETEKAKKAESVNGESDNAVEVSASSNEETDETEVSMKMIYFGQTL